MRKSLRYPDRRLAIKKIPEPPRKGAPRDRSVFPAFRDQGKDIIVAHGEKIALERIEQGDLVVGIRDRPNEAHDGPGLERLAEQRSPGDDAFESSPPQGTSERIGVRHAAEQHDHIPRPMPFGTQALEPARDRVRRDGGLA